MLDWWNVIIAVLFILSNYLAHANGRDRGYDDGYQDGLTEKIIIELKEMKDKDVQM